MSQRLKKALRGRMDRAVEDGQAVMQLATVQNADDLTLELHEGRITLHDDEIDMSQWMRKYHRDTGLEAGDTVIVLRKATSGEIHWVVLDVVGDREPA